MGTYKNLAIARARVLLADDTVVEGAVIARRGEARVIHDQDVVAETLFASIVEARRDRVFVVTAPDGSQWVVDRGPCGRCGHVDRGTEDLSMYRG